MYDEQVSIFGITLAVDAINRKRTDDSDNVIPIIWEEQPITWLFAQPHIKRALTESQGDIDFLDVGTGSGVFGILMAKHYSARVLAIDISQRAISFATTNAINNGIDWELRLEEYAGKTAPRKSAKIIGLNAPFHIYPSNVSKEIPQHARGGCEGYERFYDQIRIATLHLALQGIIFFVQMCVGDEIGPKYVKDANALLSGLDGYQFHWSNILPRIDTWDFLTDVYGLKHKKFVYEMASEYPFTYFTMGIIQSTNSGRTIKEVAHNLDLRGRSWKDRIALHREIAEHEFR